MPLLSIAVFLLVLGTLLLLRVEGAPGLGIPKTVMTVGSVGVIAAYLVFVGDDFSPATQLAIGVVSSLVFTAGFSAMMWKVASRRMAVTFGLAVGSVILAAGTGIAVRLPAP